MKSKRNHPFKFLQQSREQACQFPAQTKRRWDGNVLAIISRLVLGLMLFAFLSAFQNWEKPAQPPAFQQLKEVVAHPSSPGNVLVASDHQIFENFLPGGQWKNVQAGGGTLQAKINRLVSFKEIPDAVFVLTRDGAFSVDLKTKNWKRIFDGKTDAEKSALAFEILPEDPEHWFLGTKGGLWESDDQGKTWFRFERFRRERISIIRFIHDRLFVASEEHLYISKDLTRFDTVFSLNPASNQIKTELLEEALKDAEDFPEDSSEPEKASDFYALLSSPSKDLPLLWLATRKGVFESADAGLSWRALSTSGMRSADCRHLIYSPKKRRLFAGTPKGVYAYQPHEDRWKELFEGLEQTDIRGLALIEADTEILVAVTGSGFIQYPILPDHITSPKPDLNPLDPGKFRLFKELVKSEPSALEVHKAVIRYANVKNGKIKRWHTASRLSSLLPRFSFGRNMSMNNNIDIDRGGTTTPDEFIFGPNDLKKAWDMDLSWDLSGFVWSSAQTSIDSREKLMVELRGDLLAEATRIFYERRRLQMDIVFSPAGSEREYVEKLLRMDELTALLDGMTNGFFSKKLGLLYHARPELAKLWDYNLTIEG